MRCNPTSHYPRRTTLLITVPSDLEPSKMTLTLTCDLFMRTHLRLFSQTYGLAFYCTLTTQHRIVTTKQRANTRICSILGERYCVTFVLWHEPSVRPSVVRRPSSVWDVRAPRRLNYSAMFCSIHPIA